ncbi:hypothetical protein IFM89_039383 [Coptis chinensis]|uniref:Uncharacterized protein n=1 Tax=Coptis chinensis TaxID=261450 RepID=A0A835HJP1_9MAGN|nr:hypothetical protein IFM89_039383 [Coptis chinensis]
MRKTAKMEKAAKSVSEISLEVDKLSGQVKLDAIMVDGDVKLQRRMQQWGSLNPEADSEEFSWLKSSANPTPTKATAVVAVVTTKWETFDPAPPLIRYPSTPDATTTPANKLTWEFFE